MSASVRTKEPLFAGLLYLGAARASVVVMNLVATSHLAHTLDAANFGLNNFAASFIAYFMIVVNLGYETFVTREVACDPTRLRGLVDSMVSMRLLLAAVLYLLLIATLWLIDLPPLGRVVVLIQGANLFGSAIGLTCVYQGLQRMRVVAGREFAASLINLACIVSLIHTPDDVIAAACIAGGTLAFTNIPIILQYRKDFAGLHLRLPREGDIAIAIQSSIYFWSMLMITITSNMHVVLLGLMRNNTEVGLFAAGWKLFNFSVFLPNIISTLFLPRIAKLTGQPAARARTLGVYMQIILVCAVPTSVFGGMLAPQILTVLFGQSYLSADKILVTMMVHGFVVSVNIILGTPLMAVGRQRALMFMMGTGVAVGVMLNLILIPCFGAEGAALATLADELTILILFACNRPEVPLRSLAGFASRCFLAVLPAGLMVHVLSSSALVNGSDVLVIVLAGLLGSCTYLTTLRLMNIDVIRLAADLRYLS